MMLIDDTLRLLSPPSSTFTPVGSNPVAAPRVGFAADCGGGEARLLGAYARKRAADLRESHDRRL